MTILPFIISSATGYLLLSFLTRKAEPLNLPLRLILGTGLGLGLSSHLTFYSFLFFNHLEPKLIITAHLLILVTLMILRTGDPTKKEKKSVRHLFVTLWTGGAEGSSLLARNEVRTSRVPQRQDPLLFFRNHTTHLVVSILTFLIITAVIIQARFYPYGGWDAWQVWNYKAKFLLLSGDNWKDLFSPELWRTSPHYPLLLPLINVWAWLFTPKPVDATTMITSVGFTFLTVGLLVGALWQRTKNIFSILPGFLLLTLPFFNLLATTQYCDIVLSFYLLAAVVTLSEQKSPYSFISGLLTGLLAFTKPEGMVAALLIFAIVIGLTVMSLCQGAKGDGHFFQIKNKVSVTFLWLFISGLTLASLPTFAFHIIYSPGNQTFINGLTSALKPATWERLQIIMAFWATELISGKWNGLWFLILAGIILGGKNIWTKNKITAGFLLLYLAVIIAYYQINTYFEIKWWLSVSLNRILFSLLPLFMFWVFSAILTKKTNK